MSSAPPSVTLYVSNLNIKIRKEELRRTLYALFGVYGKVLDVVHTRAQQVRGAAFIVFRDLASSNSALRGLDGEAFYGKQLQISYARSVSHATIAQAEGPEAVYAIKLGLRTAADKKSAGTSRLTVSGAQKEQQDAHKKSKRSRNEENSAGEEVESEDDEDEETESGPEKKKGKITAEASDDDDDAMQEESDEEQVAVAPNQTNFNSNKFGAPVAETGTEPNPVLFIQGLPAEVTADMLLPLFQQYPGLSTLKLLPRISGSAANAGNGFVHYETTAQAGTAREALNNFLLAPETPLIVEWAKRS